MNFFMAIGRIDELFDEHGYSQKVAFSKERSLYILKTEHGLSQCTSDWPTPYLPSKEDMETKDWEIKYLKRLMIYYDLLRTGYRNV